MKSNKNICVILVGGSGKRLIPISCESNPKQFHVFDDNNLSLIQQTYQRLLLIYEKKNIYFLTCAKYVKKIKEQIKDLRKHQLIIEPSQRNTGPAINFAIRFLLKKYTPNSVVSFFPADHYIDNNEQFLRSINDGISLAIKTNQISLIGLKPIFPSTNYGYIRYQDNGKEKSFLNFIEKPDFEKAKKMLDEKCYLWNLGIFILSLQVGSNLFETMEYKQNKVVDKILKSYSKNRRTFLYNSLDKISFDKQILEKNKKISIVEANFYWSDLGTWESIIEESKRRNLSFYNSGNFIYNKSKFNIILNTKASVAVIIGENDIVISDIDSLNEFISNENINS